MRVQRLDLLLYLVAATIAFGVVAETLPGDRDIAVRIYALAVGALLMTAVVSSFESQLPRGRTSDLTRALDEKPPEPERIADLRRMEREVTLAVGNAHDLHTKLLPHLRDIAAARLERGGRRPGPETLGRWWELLRPDRPPPDERFARGISEAELRDLVADLERM
ncbi:MAG TPA: hypothetical protein VFA97_00230 [Gaiellaceae bacterium]|nr:hypothetical protein [Gaiellaceae bacterium]